MADNLSAYLRKLRERASLSQDEVSARAEVSETYYGKVEGGKRRPSMDVMMRICDALNCTADERRVVAVLLAEQLLSPSGLATVLESVTGGAERWVEGRSTASWEPRKDLQKVIPQRLIRSDRQLDHAYAR